MKKMKITASDETVEAMQEFDECCSAVLLACDELVGCAELPELQGHLDEQQLRYVKEAQKILDSWQM